MIKRNYAEIVMALEAKAKSTPHPEERESLLAKAEELRRKHNVGRTFLFTVTDTTVTPPRQWTGYVRATPKVEYDAWLDSIIDEDIEHTNWWLGGN